MKDEQATSTIVLRVTPSRKAAYVRAAHPRTLSAWMFEQCDEAAKNDAELCGISPAYLANKLKQGRKQTRD